jgi:NADH:ubiquinone oxidoreductase subunit F (NADH-binding)
MSKVNKKKSAAAIEQKRAQMKFVTSDTCAVCKTPCTRGLAYLETMKVPGAVGTGVPCVLTLPVRKP